MEDATLEHGWTTVPRSLEKLVNSRKSPRQSTPLTTDDIFLPDSELVQQVSKYAKDRLPAETFNHSMRVFYYGERRVFDRYVDSHSHSFQVKP